MVNYYKKKSTTLAAKRARNNRARGDLGQQEIVAKYYDFFSGLIEQGDVTNKEKGLPGSDTRKSPKAQRLFPWHDEIKRVKACTVSRWMEQSAGHGKGDFPCVHFREDVPKGKKANVLSADKGNWFTVLPTEMFFYYVRANLLINGYEIPPAEEE